MFPVRSFLCRGCLRDLAVVNNAVAKVRTQVFLSTVISFPADKHPEAGLLGRTAVFFSSVESPYCFHSGYNNFHPINA